MIVSPYIYQHVKQRVWASASRVLSHLPLVSSLLKLLKEHENDPQPPCLHPTPISLVELALSHDPQTVGWFWSHAQVWAPHPTGMSPVKCSGTSQSELCPQCISTAQDPCLFPSPENVSLVSAPAQTSNNNL